MLEGICRKCITEHESNKQSTKSNSTLVQSTSTEYTKIKKMHLLCGLIFISIYAIAKNTLVFPMHHWLNNADVLPSALSVLRCVSYMNTPVTQLKDVAVKEYGCES